MTEIKDRNDSDNNNTNNNSIVSNQNREVMNVNARKSLSNIDLFDEKQLAAATNFLTQVMRSEKGGIKSVNDGLAILMRAQDLNLPFSTSIEHIHVINGKTGIDIHIIKALLLRAGVTWETLNDYTPLYEYTDNFNVYLENELPDFCIKCKNKTEATELNKDNKDNDCVYVYPVTYYKSLTDNTVYKNYQLNSNYYPVSSIKEGQAVAKNNKIPIIRINNQPIDYIVKYKFNRIINGKKMESIGKFSYTEAVQAGFFEKDTYSKYPRILISHRAFTYGARDIASDILLGSCETTELKIITGSELTDRDIIDIDISPID